MDAPLISVVIPTFARPRRLRDCLEGIAALRADGVPFEVVVVDDGGPVALDTVVADFADRLAIELVVQAHGGPGSARNAGAAVARGRYLAFLDDDCRPAPDWLAVLVRELERDAQRLLGGRVENALVDNAYSETSEWIGRYVYEYNRGDTAVEPFFTTNNIALSAELFRAVGGFSTRIPAATAEDKDFCDRWRARGLTLFHVPAAVVYHAHELTFPRFVRQHFNYGRGILGFRLLRRARERSSSDRLVPEPLGFYAGLLLSPLRARSARRRGLLTALLVVAQLATLAGAAREGISWPFRARSRGPGA